MPTVAQKILPVGAGNTPAFSNVALAKAGEREFIRLLFDAFQTEIGG